MKESQEPKYDVTFEAKICNRSTRRVIPDDEPIFIFRAKDKNAVTILELYQRLCSDKNHQEVIGKRIEDFKRFANNNPKLMGEPDSPPL